MKCNTIFSIIVIFLLICLLLMENKENFVNNRNQIEYKSSEFKSKKDAVISVRDSWKNIAKTNARKCRMGKYRNDSICDPPDPQTKQTNKCKQVVNNCKASFYNLCSGEVGNQYQLSNDVNDSWKNIAPLNARICRMGLHRNKSICDPPDDMGQTQKCQSVLTNCLATQRNVCNYEMKGEDDKIERQINTINENEISTQLQEIHEFRIVYARPANLPSDTGNMKSHIEKINKIIAKIQNNIDKQTNYKFKINPQIYVVNRTGLYEYDFNGNKVSGPKKNSAGKDVMKFMLTDDQLVKHPDPKHTIHRLKNYLKSLDDANSKSNIDHYNSQIQDQFVLPANDTNYRTCSLKNAQAQYDNGVSTLGDRCSNYLLLNEVPKINENTNNEFNTPGTKYFVFYEGGGSACFSSEYASENSAYKTNYTNYAMYAMQGLEYISYYDEGFNSPRISTGRKLDKMPMYYRRKLLNGIDFTKEDLKKIEIYIQDNFMHGKYDNDSLLAVNQKFKKIVSNNKCSTSDSNTELDGRMGKVETAITHELFHLLGLVKSENKHHSGDWGLGHLHQTNGNKKDVLFSGHNWNYSAGEIDSSCNLEMCDPKQKNSFEDGGSCDGCAYSHNIKHDPRVSKYFSK